MFYYVTWKFASKFIRLLLLWERWMHWTMRVHLKMFCCLMHWSKMEVDSKRFNLTDKCWPLHTKERSVWIRLTKFTNNDSFVLLSFPFFRSARLFTELVSMLPMCANFRFANSSAFVSQSIFDSFVLNSRWAAYSPTQKQRIRQNLFRYWYTQTTHTQAQCTHT